MRFNTYINNVKCIEWGLNASQGALFDLLNQLSSWADASETSQGISYHISRNKVIEELPLFYSKPDTVYRHFIILHEKGLISYQKQGSFDFVCLTQKGRQWNSEMNPNSDINPIKLGTKSEKDSEPNPTYNNTNTHNTTSDTIDKDTFLSDQIWCDTVMYNFRICSDELAQHFGDLWKRDYAGKIFETEPGPRIREINDVRQHFTRYLTKLGSKARSKAGSKLAKFTEQNQRVKDIIPDSE